MDKFNSKKKKNDFINEKKEIYNPGKNINKEESAKIYNIQFLKDLINDSYIDNDIFLDNTFIVFKSIEDILYLI